MPTNKPKSTAGAVATISQSELQEKYPFFKPLQTPNLSQDQLREYAELLDNVMMASDLNKEALAIEKQHLEPGRKKMSALVAKIYALYLSVEASTQKREIYEEYRGLLKTKYKVTVHEDAPRSALVMKIVLPKIDSKTAHLYGRALDLAKGYEVDPSDYVGFVKGLGGYEKIRKAYAKVLAADAGKMLPLQKYAADSATRAFVSGLEPVAAYSLTAEEGYKLNQYRSSEGYCYLITRIDMHGYMEILSPIPPGNGWEDQLLKHIQKATAKLPEWLAEYKRVYDLVVKRHLVKTVEKKTKAAELAKKRQQRAENQKKKDEAFKRKLAKQRAAADKAAS